MKTSKPESAVLSALISEPSLINHKGVHELTPDDFRHESAQLIFKVIQDDGLDLVGLLDKLSGEDRALVIELSEEYTSKANLHVYAEMIKEASEKRGIHRTLSNALESVMEGEEVGKVKTDLITSLTATGKTTDRTLDDICGSIIDDMERRVESGGYLGLSTGFHALDEVWQGMDSGDLIILAARPGMGKTALALNIARHTAKNGNVMFFSLEMPSEQIVNRLISDIGSVPSDLIKKPVDMDDVDWSKYSRAMGEVKKQNWTFFDESMELHKLISNIRRKSIEKRPDLIVVDYLQLINAKAESRVMEVTKISGALKAIAKEMKCPVLALSQLSRKVEERSEKIPNNSDLRDSGSIEQDADKIAFIYRDEVYNEESYSKGLAEVITTKNRAGEIGSVTLESKLRYFRFESTDRKAERSTAKPKKVGFNR